MVRVDRKIWGPGRSPGSRVVVAYPGDDIDEAVLAEVEPDAPELPKPEKKPAKKPASAKTAAKSTTTRRRRTKPKE